MSGATYICQIGCMSECSHGLACLVYRSDAEHPHPPKHIAVDENDLIHEWRGTKGYGRCAVSRQEATR